MSSPFSSILKPGMTVVVSNSETHKAAEQTITAAESLLWMIRKIKAGSKSISDEYILYGYTLFAGVVSQWKT